MSFSHNMAVWSLKQKAQRAQTAQDLTAYYAQVTKRAHTMGRAKREEIDGYKFASEREGQRYKDLKLMERAGRIRKLKPHPSYEIAINGIDICTVTADFYYEEARSMVWVKVVEDVKSQRIGRDGKVKFSTDTRHSKIGRKLVLAVHGVEIVTVK